MSIEAWHAIKALEKKVADLDKSYYLLLDLIAKSAQHSDAIAQLQNQYKMLNARISRKNNGETDRT